MAINEYDEAVEDLQAPTQKPLLPTAAAPAPPRNEFAQAVDQMRNGQQRQLQHVARENKDVAPDQRAETLRLSSQFKMPPEIVERDIDYYRALQQQDGNIYKRLLTQAPKLSQWLASDPWKAGAALDDTLRLANLERTMEFGGHILRAVDNMQSMFGGFLEWGGEATGIEGLKSYGKGVREHNELQAAELGGTISIDDITDLDTFGRWMKQAVGEQLPIMATMSGGAAAGAAIGGAIGAPAAGVGAAPGAIIGSIIGAGIPALMFGLGETQAQMKQIDPTAEAPLKVFLGGSAIAALDTVLPAKVGSALVRQFGRETAEQIAKRALLAPVKPRFLVGSAREGFTGFLMEGFTEAIQEAIGALASSQGAVVPLNVSAMWKQMREAAATGAVVGGVTSFSAHTVGFQRELSHYAASQQQQLFFQALGDTSANSELAKRLPEAYQDVVRAMTKDGPVETVYVDVEEFERYFQSKDISAATVADELTGETDTLARAKESGMPIAIPTAAYATKLAGTEHHAHFTNELRLRPDMPNAREAEAMKGTAERIMGEMQDAVDAAAAGTETTEAASTPLRQAIVATLLADAGFHAMVSREQVDPLVVANTYAASTEHIVSHLATQAGEDPLAFLDTYNLTIGTAGTTNGVRNALAAVQAVQGATIEASDTVAAPEPADVALEATRAASEGVVLYQRERARTSGLLPKGFEIVSPHLLPEERASIRRDVVERVTEAFRSLPGEADYMAAALAGKAKRGWYDRSTRAIQTVFGEVDAPRFAALLAALSPRTSVEANLLNAVTTWRNWVEAGRPTTRTAITEILSRSVQQSEGKDSVLLSWVPNTITALSTEDPTTIRLSGPKVNPFMLNLLGHTQQVTTDAWMTVFAGTMHAITGKGLSRASHMAFAAKIRRAAIQLTRQSGETWTPAEVQETVWSWAKTLYELSESAGLSAEDVITQGLISDAAITATPDFAQLFSQDGTVREILEAAGYGPVLSLIETDVVADDAAFTDSGLAAAGGDPAPREAAPVTPSLLRSARRLDWVRQARQAVSRQPYDALLSRLLEGGFTYSVLTDQSPTRGLALGLYPDRSVVLPLSDVTPMVLADFAIANGDLLLKSGNYFGAWIDGDQVVLDISEIVSSPKQAQAIGQKAEQMAYFDLAAGIPVTIDYPPGWVHGPTWQGPGGSGAVVNEAGESVAAPWAPERGSDPDAVQTADGEGRDAGGAPAGPAETIPTDARVDDGVVFFQEQLDVSTTQARDAQTQRRTAVPAPAGTGRPASENQDVQAVADQYADPLALRVKEYGYADVDQVRAGEIADLYDALPEDASSDPEVRRAYAALGREVQAQWDAVLAAGYALLPWTKTGQPYATSTEMAADIRDHRRLHFFTGGQDHPFLGDATRDEAGLTLNDKFRAIHDFFGHAAGGYGFGARGEENAWRVHSQMFTRDARRAMTTETRGQNSWVNFGAHNYTADGTYRNVPPADRPYATQKVALLPDQYVFEIGPVTLYQTQPIVQPTVGQFAYSRLVRAVEMAKQAKANGRQWKDIITGSKIGVNHDEFLLSDVSDLVDGTSYTREEVLEYLRQHQVAITWQILDESGGVLRADVDARAQEVYDDEVIRLMDRAYDRGHGPVADLSEIDERTETDDEGLEMTTFVVEDNEFDTLAEAEEYAFQLRDDRQESLDQEFANDIRNNVSYDAVEEAVRQEMLDEAEAEGRVIKYAEYQLDGGHGTEPGSYREAFLQAPGMRVGGLIETLPEGATETVWVPRPDWRDGHEDYFNIVNPIVRLRFNVRAVNGPQGPQRVLFLEELQPPLEGDEFDAMPALFQKNWRELGLKWALRHAAELNLDGIAWTNGQQQRDRYRLSRAIESMTWQPVQQGTQIRMVRRDMPAGAEAARGHIDVLVDEAGDVVESPHWGVIEGQKLSAVIGTELAARIVREPSGAIVDSNLDVGGAGLARLYDVDFPNAAKKLPAVKKHGGQVSTVTIERRSGETDMQPAVLFTPEMKTAVLAGQALFQEDEEQEQGSITLKRSGVRIEFLQNANLSTFLHETGHLYLHMMGDLVDKLRVGDPTTWTDGQRQLVEDYGRALTFLGVATRDQVQRPEHEKFARAFEAYLRVGKAPVPAMRPVFSRFRSWLTRIYRAATDLHVDMSPEITEVFDRLVATQDAIAQATKDAAVPPLFSTPEQAFTVAGIGPVEWQGYQKLLRAAHEEAEERVSRRILQELQRERSTWWRTTKKALREEVTLEVRSRREYAAMLFLQRGELPDGSEAPAPVKIAKASIVEKFNADRLKTLPRPYVYSVEGGLDVDEMARMLGFGSGDELLTSLAETTATIEDVVAGETDRRMDQLYGNMRIDGTLRQEARAAVREGAYEEVLAAELKALAAAARRVKPIVTAAREQTVAEEASARRALRQALRESQLPADQLAAIAEQRLASVAPKDIKPHLYGQTAQKEGTAASQAMADGRYEDAVAAKTRQRMAVALQKAATHAIEETDALEKYAKRLGQRSAQARLGKAGESYQAQVNNLLNKFEFQRVTNKALDRRVTLGEWVAERQAEGLPVDIPADVLEAAQRTNFRQVPIQRLRELRDALKTIEHLARLKNELLTSKNKREYDDQRDALVASLRAKNTLRPGELEFRRADVRKHSIANWFAAHTKIATLAQRLDGDIDGGLMWTLLVRPLNEAADRETARRDTEGTRYNAILKKHYPGRELGRWNQMVAIPAINASLSREAILSIALNWGNETSRDRILSDPKRQWSRHQVEAILDKLDQRDWSFVQETWDYLDSFWPEVSDKTFRITGLRPEKVDHVVVDTKYGQFRGGYYPLAYDHRLAPSPGTNQISSDAKQALQAAYLRTTTKRGHLKQRLDHLALPVRFELGVMFEHLDQVIHDLTHHEALIDVSRLLRDREVSSAIHDVGGDPVYRQFTDALTDIAIGKRPGGGPIDRAAAFAKTGAQISALGLNLWTAMQQPLGLFNGAARVGGKWVARGLFRWMRDGASMQSTVAWIHDVSPFMKGRAFTMNQDITDLRRRLTEPGGWFDTLVRGVSSNAVTQANVTDSFLWHISLAQRVADVPTWLGMYEKQMAGGKSEADAIVLADQAVRDSQGGGQMVDLAAVQRGGDVARLFMVFYTYGSTVFNQTSRAYNRTQFSSPTDVARFLGDLSLLYFWPALASVLLSRLLRGSGEDDDDLFDVSADVLTEMGGSALNSMVLLRELGGLLRASNRGYEGPAGTRLLQQIYRLGGQVAQGEVDEGLWKALNQVGGVFFRYPAGQIQRTVDGAVALQDGRTDNPLALLFGPPRE